MNISEIKQTIAALDKRDQIMLGVLVIALVLYVLIGLIWLGLKDDRDLLAQRVAANDKLITWMEPTVVSIKKFKGAGNRSSANLSLSQLAQQAAKSSNLIMTRFQPKGNEAQVWLDKVPFEDVLKFLSTLEQQYSVNMQSVTINTGNAPGVVNARVKFIK